MTRDTYLRVERGPEGMTVSITDEPSGPLQDRDYIAEAAAQGRADALAGEPAFVNEADYWCDCSPNCGHVRAGSHTSTLLDRECRAYAAAYEATRAALAEVPAVIRGAL